MKKARDIFRGLPKSVDWRKEGAVSPVRRQGVCGCCWAITAASAVEGLHKIITGKLVELSPQELIDHDRKNHGCHGGKVDVALSYVASKGLSTLVDYPFIAGHCLCTPPEDQLSCCYRPREFGSERVKITGWRRIYAEGDEHALLRAIAKQPVCVSVDGASPEFANYTGGLFRQHRFRELNHEMLAVGYDLEGEEPFITLKNTVGSLWGEEGYMRMVIGTRYPEGICGVNLFAHIPYVKGPKEPRELTKEDYEFLKAFQNLDTEAEGSE